MTSDITIEDTEFPGAMRMRTVEVDVSNYDDDGSGDGESFVPNDAGMNRFIFVTANVADGSGMMAQYDRTTESLRLYYGGTDGGEFTEVGSDNDEGATVEVTAFGK